MFETVPANQGVGLAAPQIALALRLFVVECADAETGKHYKMAMANPEIIDGILYPDRLDRPEDLHEVRPDEQIEEAAFVE